LTDLIVKEAQITRKEGAQSVALEQIEGLDLSNTCETLDGNLDDLNRTKSEETLRIERCTKRFNDLTLRQTLHKLWLMIQHRIHETYPKHDDVLVFGFERPRHRFEHHLWRDVIVGQQTRLNLEQHRVQNALVHEIEVFHLSDPFLLCLVSLSCVSVVV